MILNEPVETVIGECIIYGAPNEEITLKNIENEQTYKCTLNSNGEYIYGSLYYGVYIISGSISKKVYPEGRLVFFNLFNEIVTKNGKQYRIISAYPEKTWFWFGREFGTWKCSQDTPGSAPFIDKNFIADPNLTNTCSVDKEKGCLKIYSQSSVKDKGYGWTGTVQKILTPENTARICFLAKADLQGSTTKIATVGLGYNIQDGENVNIGPYYNFFLQADLTSTEMIYEASTENYQKQPCLPVIFIANDSDKDGTVKSTSAEIYAIWMDEIVPTGGGTTPKQSLGVYSQTLRSDICIMGGNGWTKASATNKNSENYFGSSSSNGSEGGVPSVSSMAIPLTFDFSGNSKKLTVECDIYIPYSPPFYAYWAITTDLEPYRAKDTNQSINGSFPEVTNDPYKRAGGIYTFNHLYYKKIKMEFPCTTIPKREKFYLIFYTKTTNRKGAAHAQGTLSAWVDYGVDK